MRKISQWIITIYDRKTYEKRDSFFVLYAVIVSLAGFTFNPMGVATAQLKATLEGHTNVVWSVAFSPDGQILASGSWDQTVRLWDVETEQLLHTLSGHTNEVLSVAFSPEGGTLVSSDWDGNIRLWNPETGKLKRTLTDHRGGVGSVVFSPDGTRLASGSADQTVWLWNTTTWQVERMLTDHTSVVDVVAFSPDGATLASESRDGTIRLWDPNTGTHTTTFTIESEVNRLAFSPDGETLASGSSDQTVRLWNPHTGALKNALPNQGGWVNAVAFSPDGETLVIGNRGISLWDTETGQYKAPLATDIGNAVSVVFSPDGQTVASGSADNLVRLWDFTVTDWNVGEPRTLRMIYFLPNDRPYRADVVQRIKDDIRKAQIFFAEQMGGHGYGNKTFRVETDSQGDPMVHRVDGQHPNSHYFYDMESKVRDEIAQTFNLDANLYFIVLGTDAFRLNNGQAGGGTGRRYGKSGGYAMVSGELGFELTAHELGHAFGLYHDFNDGTSSTYIMSYGRSRNQISACHADYLTMSPYFNLNVPIEYGQPPTIELISSRIYPAGSKSVPIQLKISDSEGLHQVLLFVRTSKKGDSQGIDRAPQLKLCRGLEGKKETIVEFDYDGVIPSDSPTSFSNPMTHPISVEAVDMNGNVARTDFVLFSETLQPLMKISGDNQTGLPNTPLPVPFVVQVRGLNDGTARSGVSTTFTVTAGDGTLSITHTTTDENGRAESTLTLGPNLGTTTVEVSAAGIEHPVTFNAVTGAAVDLPDPNLRAAIEAALGKAEGDPIAPAEMATLTRLEAPNANISDLTGLEFATNLTELGLGPERIGNEWRNSNAVKDLSPLAGLTRLTRLHLPDNSISDISAVADLTHLTWLNLENNSISDLSPLVANAGLGDGEEIYLWGNPLSYTSIKAHIPVLKNRGVTVEFDNQAHPALLKISGDNQNGASFVPLSHPFVVEAQDANGFALVGVSVTFAVTAGGGALSTTITRTDTNGRAQSTLTLGPNLGTNTVKVSAAGIQVPATFHAISNTESPPITADVNGDGSVNVLDLIVVASKLGNQGQNLAVDVNGDRVVSILDLILVAGMFDGAAAAPSAQPRVPETLTVVEVRGWLTDARTLEVRDPIMKRGFVVLEQLLVSLTPTETESLANYPNPFNPETWIPYRLAEDAFVTLTIYDSNGQVVRTLEVGHRIAAVYESRSKAVHWDGRNNLGEQVASGVYFYTLTAGGFSETRKMVILK